MVWPRYESRLFHGSWWDPVRVLRCIFGPNLALLTSIGADLSKGQTHKLKTRQIFGFKFNLALKVMVNRPKNIRILTNVNYTYLVTDVHTGRQTDGHTRTHTHTHTQATIIPEGQNWPQVKTLFNWRCQRSPLLLFRFNITTFSKCTTESKNNALFFISQRVKQK